MMAITIFSNLTPTAGFAALQAQVAGSIDGDGTLKAGAVDVPGVIGESILQVPNLANDAFFQFTEANVDWGGRVRWVGGAGLSMVRDDATNVYGGTTLRLDTAGAVGGVQLWYDEIGVGVGNVLIASMCCNLASGTYRMYAQHYTAAGAAVGAKVSSGTTITGDGVPEIMTCTLPAVPATAVCSKIYVQRLSGSSVMDIQAIWVTKGDYVGSRPAPSVQGAWLAQRLNALDLAQVQPAITYTVAAAGGDYTTLAAALTQAALVARCDRWVKIRILDGTYAEVSNIGTNWVILEGQSRDGTILQASLGGVDLTKDVLKINGKTMVIRNLTLDAHNVKYCLHIDNPSAMFLLLDNLWCKHDTNFPIGIGLYANQHLYLRDVVRDYRGTADIDFGIWLHGGAAQAAGFEFVDEGGLSLNCGIAWVREMNSGRPDVVRFVDPMTTAVDKGIYFDADDVADTYTLQLYVEGGVCPRINVDATTRPNQAIRAPGVYDRMVKNSTVATIVAGSSVAIDYTVVDSVRVNVGLSASRCDGVALADIVAAADGWVCLPGGRACQVLATTAEVTLGEYLKPKADGQWESATEAAVAVALGTKAAGSTGLVLARLL